MSALLRVRNTDHYHRLEEEVKERGYERDYDFVTSRFDTPHMAVVFVETKNFEGQKTAEEVDNDLKDLVFGFVEMTFQDPDRASYKL